MCFRIENLHVGLILRAFVLLQLKRNLKVGLEPSDSLNERNFGLKLAKSSFSFMRISWLWTRKIFNHKIRFLITKFTWQEPPWTYKFYFLLFFVWKLFYLFYRFHSQSDLYLKPFWIKEHKLNYRLGRIFLSFFLCFFSRKGSPF